MTERKSPDKAVAILYNENNSAAPKIVASGKGVIAEKIINTARDAGIHIQQDANLVELLSKIEVGDEKGHVLAMFETKQIFINETTGEKNVSVSKNTMDINPKAGKMTVTGYGVTIDPNGDQLIRKQEGKAVGKGHMKGTWSYIKATGKHDGTKGGGTWESWSLAPLIVYYEVNGEVDRPKQ